MKNPFRQPEALWKISFPFKYAQLELFEEYFASLTDSVSSYELSSKTVESMPDDLWCFEAYLEERPDIEDLRSKLDGIGDIDASEVKLEKIEDIDWVAQMHEDFKPLRVGRFFVTNPAHAHLCPEDMEQIVIESSRAFGTGEHSTTKGCLEAIEALHNISPKIIFDIGTGTGILAIAATKLWPSAKVIGTDIEAVAVEISKQHAKDNGASIEFITTDTVPTGYKVDLIISNILKQPLIELSGTFAASLNPGGVVILSGFLDYQLEEVENAYLKVGLKRTSLINKDGWMALTVTRHHEETASSRRGDPWRDVS
jgi:ribosomal protein L11 methyltransferase